MSKYQTSIIIIPISPVGLLLEKLEETREDEEINLLPLRSEIEWAIGSLKDGKSPEHKKLKLTCFGHIKRHQTLEKHILEAKMKGKRGKGRPTRRWENDIEEWLETSTSQARRLTSDRETFRRRVQEATSRNG
ncbi:hypothetical protein PoB_001736800 [Plakobranchus ocellatus]|uniref:Uncharacterized protein n=1 Tax=Plakobranchus ocellatus TaxID=259542 RepID=A0AAV3Z8V1_9GAST|nr:hypothetical protein PoB_001736800 [Plakobranchus ocellatus]